MAFFRIVREVPLPAGTVWERLTHWEGHAAHVPFTAVEVITPPSTRSGTRFVARTRLGPVAFDDPMEVVRWEPPRSRAVPGYCRVEKRGRVVQGWAEIALQPVAGEAGARWCRVVWSADVRLRGVPRFFDGLTGRAARLMYGRVIDGLLLGTGRAGGRGNHDRTRQGG
ncbi:Immediate-early protein 2 [Streptosporangium nondiastaticum]|uniref:Immediate-early protein 2 n=1 Tax=Streptosporangium nondiastaticum TaxID=35764 RepID=A0A9X7JVV8_9ACTN|nr:Immediate-early protein 2 [Streptosporangium nondiastaticum]